MEHNNAFKTCPFCQEQIRQEAVKCRYCGEWLQKPPAKTDSTPTIPVEPEPTCSRSGGTMTREQFYERLTNYLRAAKYASQASPSAIRAGARTPLWMTVAASAAASAVGGLGAALALSSVNRLDAEHAATRTAELEAVFRPMLSFTPLLFYKFILGSISIFTAIEADALSDGEILQIVSTFDDCLLKTTQFAAQRAAYFGRKQQAGSINGSLMFIFFDSLRASDFRERLQKQCYTRHFRKMTYLYALAVDVAQQQVFTHSPIKMLTSLGDRKITAKLFNTQIA
jgi:hypothetical protein